MLPERRHDWRVASQVNRKINVCFALRGLNELAEGRSLGRNGIMPIPYSLLSAEFVPADEKRTSKALAWAKGLDLLMKPTPEHHRIRG